MYLFWFEKTDRFMGQKIKQAVFFNIESNKIVFTLRRFSQIQQTKKFVDYQFTMILYSSFLILVMIICQSLSYILIPPFLPNAYRNQYYEQKFRISQLDTAQFKITGLPRGMFWTSNGTVFGIPSSLGSWTINLAYDSLTQSGSYQTTLTVRDLGLKQGEKLATNQHTNPVQIVFPDNLIFVKNVRQQIEFRVRNVVQPVSWRFVTLPKGVSQTENGKLSVKIEKEGIFILRIQVNDNTNNEAQACVTLNVQSSKLAFNEFYAVNTIYEPSQNVNRLLEVNRKQTQVMRQLNEAALKLGQQNSILRENEEALRRVSNNLIQLQNEARFISQAIQDAIKDKKMSELKLKEAYEILMNAENQLNFALIQQQSNHNHLNSSQMEKARAQTTYDRVNRQLEAHVLILSNIERKILNKQQQRQANLKILADKKGQYSELSKQIIPKEQQLAFINQQVFRLYQQVVTYEANVRSQKEVINQEQNKYLGVLNILNITDSKIQGIENKINELTIQRGKIVSQILKLESALKQIQAIDLFNLQKDIQDNQLAIQMLLFESIKQWNSIEYQSSFVREYLRQVRFGGCNLTQFPSVQGIFKIKQVSLTDFFYQTQTGHRILFGKCTRSSNFKSGDQVVVSGRSAQGVIHADRIVLQ